ncbi:MAG: alpha/beta hydrolase [Chloroflexota bacterium]|nr:alpha/beta hydrolase [Chloroflexota bacterium]
MSKTIFLIHGMWGSSTFWGRYCRVFNSKGYNTKAITLAYHDKSACLKGLRQVRLADYIEQARKEIQQLKERPIIVGHSMGGLIAQKLAEMGLAEKLVLLAPVAPRGLPVVTRSGLWTFSASVLDIALLKRPFILSFRKAAYGLLNTIPVREQVVIYRSFVYESGLAFNEIVRGKVVVDAARVGCPVLVVVGAEDRVTPPKVVRKVAARYSATYREYPDCCHYLGAEYEIACGVLAWIEGG